MDEPIAFSVRVDNVQIRHMEQQDLPALEWDGEYSHYRDVYKEEFLRSIIGESVLWVAEKPGAGVIGQVFIQLNAARQELANGLSRAYMYALRIKPPFRNLGLGTRMIEFVEMDLVNRKYCWLTLNVGKTNYAARRFYTRLGYRVVTHEAGHWLYVDDRGITRKVDEPAWRMEKFIHRVS